MHGCLNSNYGKYMLLIDGKLDRWLKMGRHGIGMVETWVGQVFSIWARVVNQEKNTLYECSSGTCIYSSVILFLPGQSSISSKNIPAPSSGAKDWQCICSSPRIIGGFERFIVSSSELLIMLQIRFVPVCRIKMSVSRYHARA